MRLKTLVSWSSGKDSAWTLHRLRNDPRYELAGLVTTVNTRFDRVAMHAVRRTLLEAQGEAAELPLWTVPIPTPCSNEEYESAMRALIARAVAAGVVRMAFGDLFLQDVREYRERMLAPTPIRPLFPLWGIDTRELAEEMLAGGLRARITCIDPRHLPADFAGRDFDATLLHDLPPSVDPCGERGEFHTFAWAGPMFAQPIPIITGERVERDGFVFADLLGQ
ncbi:MAG TPA: ATP-binding protein [Thermoanaerobaculia bacterium]|nr:ATP-binding protein [Thermoanaerobaculia bacterium]